MIDIGPDLTPAERQIAVVISRADRMLATTVSATLEKAIEQAAMTCEQSAKKTAPGSAIFCKRRSSANVLFDVWCGPGHSARRRSEYRLSHYPQQPEHC